MAFKNIAWEISPAVISNVSLQVPLNTPIANCTSSDTERIKFLLEISCARGKLR